MYKHQQVEDFLLDDAFVDWVRKGSPKTESFWQSYSEQYPEQEEMMQQARMLILALRIQPGLELTTAEMEGLIGQVHARQQEVTRETRHAFRKVQWYQQAWLRIAASVVLLLTALGWGWWQLSGRLSEPVAIPIAGRVIERKNASNQPFLVRLADGSTVILKPGGAIRYDSAFTAAHREVYLTGEAFFEVTRDPARPFMVYTQELVTKVMGTSFLVRTDQAQNRISVVVTTGLVAVSARQPTPASRDGKQLTAPEIMLKPDQQLVFYRKEARMVKGAVKQPSTLSTSLAKSEFEFVQTPVGEVLSTIAKAYGVEIQYDEGAMRHCRLTASLGERQLYEKLTIICKTIGARFVIDAGKITLEGASCPPAQPVDPSPDQSQ